ncbi:hypothetical protein N7447_005234 [Penicillium robsamsonii]|uniref:uncharacterized protein n=1 Tax=Penicillium robsamsonii TaxID=1792511 RepID=UPI002548A253|nr:uncharacterized protein N7447_005234 [Penicillium robsamsonii]KAJ5822894.1 hypothetical protein N7447_005234 [Penicillium robsamsonii]
MEKKTLPLCAKIQAYTCIHTSQPLSHLPPLPPAATFSVEASSPASSVKSISDTYDITVEGSPGMRLGRVSQSDAAQLLHAPQNMMDERSVYKDFVEKLQIEEKPRQVEPT